jgi:hypothetical protein
MTTQGNEGQDERGERVRFYEVQDGEVIAEWCWDGRVWRMAEGPRRTMAEMADCLLVTESHLEPAPTS